MESLKKEKEKRIEEYETQLKEYEETFESIHVPIGISLLKWSGSWVWRNLLRVLSILLAVIFIISVFRLEGSIDNYLKEKGVDLSLDFILPSIFNLGLVISVIVIWKLASLQKKLSKYDQIINSLSDLLERIIEKQKQHISDEKAIYSGIISSMEKNSRPSSDNESNQPNQ